METQKRRFDPVMAVVGWSHKHMGKAVSSYGYRFLTNRIGNDDIFFLNFGYEEDPPMGLPLEPRDEADRYCIQLYHRVASQVDLTGKDVLEVSCGHGGAASYVMRYLHPQTYTGLDYNPAGIEFCQRKHVIPGLKFVHGDAENLPFPDGSFDAVVNVEAAHLYPNYSVFLKEVARVLRPGGHFLYSDLRAQRDVPEWEAAMAAAPLRMVSQEIIDEQVVRGLEKNTPRHNALISRIVPKPLRTLAGDIGGVQGGRAYKEMQRGDLSYRLFLFVKD